MTIGSERRNYPRARGRKRLPAQLKERKTDGDERAEQLHSSVDANRRLGAKSASKRIRDRGFSPTCSECRALTILKRAIERIFLMEKDLLGDRRDGVGDDDEDDGEEEPQQRGRE